MKLLFYRYNSICEPDMLAAFRALGHTVVEECTEMENKTFSPKDCIQLVSSILLKDTFDFVYSVNFYPTLSEICKIFHIPYICFIVDSPVLELYSSSIQNPNNRIFFFDKILYEEFYPKNPYGIFHMPLATNMERNEKSCKDITQKDKEQFSHDVCFIGSLYSEKCPYNQLTNLPDFLRGYFDGLMEAQLKIYGYNFIEEILTEQVVADFTKHAGSYPFPEYAEHNDKAVLAHLYLNSKVAEQERYRLLHTLSEHFQVSVYTNSDTSCLPNIHNCGFANPILDAPKIFHLSKINLNITAKPIRSGLSQRVWDVLGCGGFLICNFQPEITDYFEPGTDLEIYDSAEDLLMKVEYYLHHEEQRRQIAQNGYQKVKKHHTYITRIQQILDIVFPF